VLASASPRRKELLQKAGLELEVCLPDVVELPPGALPPSELVRWNAHVKAREGAQNFPERVVLGADTLVCLENKVFGKPGDLEEAESILLELSGRVHEVITGVCLIRIGESGREAICSFHQITRVRFHPFGKKEIAEFFLEENPLDKAGGYAAQTDRGRFVAEVEGSMDNVVGLPVGLVLDALHTHFSAVVRLPLV